MLAVAPVANAIAQGPSEPESEITITAGDHPGLTWNLKRPAEQRLNVEATYWLDGKVLKTPMDLQHTFSCNGQSVVGQQFVSLECSTPTSLLAGTYRAVGGYHTFATDQNASRDEPDSRLPIITVRAFVPPKPPPPIFLEGAGTTLDPKQSILFFDTYVKADQLRDELLRAYSSTGKEPSRRELQASVRRAAVILNHTIDLYRNAGEPTKDGRPRSELPVVLIDFSRRLALIAKDVGLPATLAEVQNTETFRAVSYQLPHSDQTVEAKENEKQSKSSFFALISFLTDLAKDSLGISQTGEFYFRWTLRTIPQGATVYYKRLGEPEQQFPGLTDMKDRELPLAVYIFRVQWPGCSEEQKVDPTRQAPIDIELIRGNCRP